MKFIVRCLARFPGWILCILFGAVSCDRSSHLGDWIEHPEKLRPGEASALQEWIASNGFDAADFAVTEGLSSVSGPRGVQIRDGRVFLLRADAATSLDGLSGLSGLHTLELDSCDLANLDGLPSDLSFFRAGGDLRSLDGIEAGTKLSSLQLYSTAVRDLAPLQGCPGITEFTASGHSWKQITVPRLPALTRLDLGRNELEEISGLRQLAELRILILRGNRLTGLPEIEVLAELQTVDLSDNRITDAARIAANAAVSKLDLKKNPIDDFSPLQAWSGLQTLVVEPEAGQVLPASLGDIAGSGEKPSGREGQERVARELKQNYLQAASFVEDAPSGGGRGERVQAKISSLFSMDGATKISGTIGIAQLEGRFRLPVAETENVLYYGREVGVAGKVSVASGRLSIYSPVEVNFWEQAALYVDNPQRRVPAPEGLQLKGYLVTEVAPGETRSFSANLLALAGDFFLLLHAPDGSASGIEFTLE